MGGGGHEHGAVPSVILLPHPACHIQSCWMQRSVITWGSLKLPCLDSFPATALTRKFQLILQERTQLPFLCDGKEVRKSLSARDWTPVHCPEWPPPHFSKLFHLIHLVKQKAFPEPLSPSQGNPLVPFISLLLPCRIIACFPLYSPMRLEASWEQGSLSSSLVVIAQRLAHERAEHIILFLFILLLHIMISC